MHNIIFLLQYILQHAHHQNFSFYPSQLIPFTHFTLPPHPSGNHYFVLLYVFVFVWFGLVIYFGFFKCLFISFCILHVSEIVRYLSFSIWFILLSIIPSRSIHIVANGKISSSLFSLFCLSGFSVCQMLDAQELVSNFPVFSILLHITYFCSALWGISLISVFNSVSIFYFAYNILNVQKLHLVLWMFGFF